MAFISSVARFLRSSRSAAALCFLLPAAAGFSLPSVSSWQLQSRSPACARSSTLCMDEAPAPAPLESYDDAEARGFELYKAGEYDRAIRMFELAQTLPGAGVDFKRQKQGGMIGSALVGTFLGILLAYGFAEPLAGLLEQKVEDAGKEFQCIKTTLLASMQGYAPAVAIEFGRKVLFSGDRPSFSELEGHVKKK